MERYHDHHTLELLKDQQFSKEMGCLETQPQQTSICKFTYQFLFLK
jgi:hypothetical protein